MVGETDPKKAVEKILREFVSLPYGLFDECAEKLAALINSFVLREREKIEEERKAERKTAKQKPKDKK